MTDNNHAILAPSSAHIWGPGGCPGSVDMQARQPEQEPTEESREGDAAHWLLSQTLLKLTVPTDAIAPNGVPINQEMRDAIVEVVTDVNDTVAGCKPGDYYRIEEKIAAHSLIHPDNDGTPDVLFVQHSRKIIHIWDFKYGHRFVDAFRCWQMINYAACAVETEEITDWHEWSFTLTIAQPRCFERDELGGTLREWFVSGAEMAGYITALSAAAHAARAPDAECRTGPHCLDCKAAWDCPANQRAAGNALHIIRSQGSTGATPDALGVEAKVLAEAMDFVKARLSSIDPQIEGAIARGQRVPFHRFGWSKPRTTWAKEKIAEVVPLAQMYGVEVKLGVALETPAQLIKQGVDATVITPYTTRNEPARKLERFDDASASKILGSR